MVSMDKVKRGIARYLDEEFTNKMSGWQKWVFGAASALYLENFTTTVDRLRQNELFKALNLMDDSGNVAIEKLHQQFRLQAQRGPITFEIPMLGTVTLSEADVEKLYTCIMQA